jgi:hypothetical protein
MSITADETDLLCAFIKRLDASTLLCAEREPRGIEIEMCQSGTRVTDIVRAEGLQQLVRKYEELKERTSINV